MHMYNLVIFDLIKMTSSHCTVLLGNFHMFNVRSRQKCFEVKNIIFYTALITSVQSQQHETFFQLTWLGAAHTSLYRDLTLGLKQVKNTRSSEA